MSSPHSEAAQEVSSSDCIAELSLRLANAVQESKANTKPFDKPHCYKLRFGHTLFAFSTPILRALLTESPSSLGIDRFLSSIDQQRDTIAHVLERVSLRGLAQYLLRSPSDNGHEMGLSLLMVCYLLLKRWCCCLNSCFIGRLTVYFTDGVDEF
ncbi:hypothetical protein BJX63DRAFT_55123 [Aspergillus granulosus]|uniref:Uncharacterized protein n=1 Tax=Aspergillus granulosus TaxID=176169 RepID=A0ABR4GY91_9EURO